MTDTQQVSTAIATVTGGMVREFDIPTILQNVTDQARACFDAHSAVVVLLDPRQIAGTAAVHIVAETSLNTQTTNPQLFTDGPGLDSARTGAIALVADLDDTDDTRWPRYRDHALHAGLRGVRAFPVPGIAAPIGSIIIHTQHPWPADQPNQVGQVFADLTALALSTGSQRRRDANLDHAIDAVLEGTTAVATALGIIAQARGLDIPGARLLLTRLARAHSTTSTAHARAIIAAQHRYPRDPGAAGVLDPPELPTPPHINH